MGRFSTVLCNQCFVVDSIWSTNEEEGRTPTVRSMSVENERDALYLLRIRQDAQPLEVFIAYLWRYAKDMPVNVSQRRKVS